MTRKGATAMTLRSRAHRPLVVSHERHHGHERQGRDAARHEPAGAVGPFLAPRRGPLEDTGGGRRRDAGPKRLGHLTRRRESVRRRAGQRALHDVVHFGRHLRPRHANGRRRGAESLRHDRLRRRPRERRLTAKHFVQHASQRVDVASGIELALTCRLLRAHVRGGAHGEPGLGQRLLARERAGHPEVRDERVAVTGEQDVLGLDVAVQDVVLVGVLEGLCRFAPDPEGVFERELPVARQPLTQALALDVRHGEPELSTRLARVEHGEDVRVLQPGCIADFALEAIGTERGGKVRVEYLQRHRSVVPEVVREIDRGHATTAEFALERVAIGESGLQHCPGFRADRPVGLG